MNTPLADTEPQRGSALLQRMVLLFCSVAALGMAVVAFSYMGMLQPTPSQGQNAMVVAAPTTGDDQRAGYVPGSAVIRIREAYRGQCFTDRIDVPGLSGMLSAAGVSGISKVAPKARPVGDRKNQLGQAFVDLSLVYDLRLPPTADVVAICQRLSEHPAVQYAEPRWLHEVFYTPNDTYLPYQWYLDTIGAPQVWSQTQGDSTIVIGIIDTGTSFSHEDLADQVAYNLADPIDGLDNDNDGYIDNYKGWDFGGPSYWAPADNDPSFVGSAPGMDHGVLVTGAACAQPDNGTGIAGAGFNTHFLPLKGSVDQSTSIGFGFDAVIYAAEHGVDIINLSWGSNSPSNFGRDAVNYAAINHGCLLVAAAGNRYQDTYVYPASFENVLSVGATEVNDTVWSSTNGTGTTYNYYVDLTAPGKAIMTTAGPDGYWGGSTGTSMSAPLVCAGAALVRAKFPQLNNIQAGELARVTAEDIYAINPSNLAFKMGKGRLDIYNAISATNVKSVRVDSMMIRDDQNDIPEPFDTLDVFARFLNYLDPVGNLQVTVSCPDTAFIEVMDSVTTVGSIGTLGSSFNTTPFRIRIKKDFHTRRRVFLKFSFSDGAYTDYQYCAFYLHPTVIDLNENKMATSINGTGNFGFTDYPYNDNGIGIRYNNSHNVVQDGGFLMAISPSKVLDNMKGLGSTRNQKFTIESKAHRIYPGSTADLEATSEYNDATAGSHQIGVSVAQHNYQFASPGHEQYIVFEYTITNTNSYPVNGIYAGMGSQWNRTLMETSNATYLPGGNMVAVNFSSTIQPNFSAGIAMLTQQPVNASVENIPGYDFSDADKYAALSNPATAVTPRAGDIVQFISAGPISLPPGGQETIAFALLAGSDVADLEVVSEIARKQYWCHIRGQVPNADLGPDLEVCQGQGVPPLLDPMGGSAAQYLWSNGDTTPTLEALSSGLYAVTVTNEHGCEAYDEVQVNYRNPGNLQIDLPLAGIQQNSGAQLSLANGNGLTSWQWDFGDGNTFFGNSITNHTFTNPGTYAISVLVSDGFCSWTVDTTVTVNPAVGLEDALVDHIQVGPNPFHDFLRVELPQGLPMVREAEMLDATGKSVWRQEYAQGMAPVELLNLPPLSNGMYFLRLKGDAFHTTLRLNRAR